MATQTTRATAPLKPASPTRKATAKPPADGTAPAKKAPATKAQSKKAAAKTPVGKQAPARKAVARRSPGAGPAISKASAPKNPIAKKTPAKQAPAARKAASARRGLSRGLGAAAAAPAGLPADFFSAYTGEPLSDADYAQAAQALGCEVAAIKAVAEVETKEAPFDAKNRPTILYERHIFARATVPPGKFNASHPDLSAKVGYGPGGYGTKDAQYGKLARAWTLDADAALKAPSWGKFQILGTNHRECGYATVGDFVKAMTVSEREHLRAFARFVAANPSMLKALRNLDWAGFAQRYNGPDYLKYKYDQKMAAAYSKFAG